MKIKNIVGYAVVLEDIGDSIDSGGTLDLNILPVDSRTSTDIAIAVGGGKLVYLNDDGTEKTTEESLIIQDSESNGIDLSGYATGEELESAEQATSDLASNVTTQNQVFTSAIESAEQATSDLASNVTTQNQVFTSAIGNNADSLVTLNTEIPLLSNRVTGLEDSQFTVTGDPLQFVAPVVGYSASTGEGMWVEGVSSGEAPDPVYTMSNPYSDTTFPISNMFDGDSSTYTWNNNTMDTVITVDYGAGFGRNITAYGIMCVLYNTYKPKKWKVHASNNGSNWTQLDSKHNQNLTQGETFNSFPMSNTTKYRYYRLKITESTAPNWVHIAEIEFNE